MPHLLHSPHQFTSWPVLLHSLHHRHTSCNIIKLMETNATREDLQKLLDILITTEDSNEQVKVFSVLALSLVSRDDFKDDIITCNVIYTKIKGILNQNLPSKITAILNFISAILYIDEDEGLTRKRSLVLYAKNMLRNSGCLLAMCCLFTSPMMYQETWSALCRCIAEACDQSQENQTFCSALVTQCVKKVIQGDMDVIPPLKSLLNNNPLNIKLFLECDGLRIFHRQFFNYDDGLQMLDKLVQDIPIQSLRLLLNQVFQHLQYLKSVHSPDTRIGQWAKVIMYHFGTRGIKEADKSVEGKKINDENSNSGFLKYNCDDTAKLMQNIVTEMYRYNTQGAQQTLWGRKSKQTDVKRNALIDMKTILNRENNFIQTRFRPQSEIIVNSQQSVSQVLQNSQNSLSFTFLNQPSGDSRVNLDKKSHIRLIQPSRDSRVNFDKKSHISQKCETGWIERRKEQTQECPDRSLDFYSYFNSTNNSSKNTLSCHRNNNNSPLVFKPIYVSTPKRNIRKLKREAPRLHVTKDSRLSRYSLRKFKKHNSKNEDCKIYKNAKYYSDIDNSRHRSISTRLFDAINESCTTFVQTVKNIFKPKECKVDTQVKDREKNAKPNDSCSYSFTEYMRKRDAALENNESAKNTTIVSEFKRTNSCKTCNDTLQLKRKIMSDDCLRQTVKKLKLGINLYGCDFKKISKAMWPRETYMTPEILYNLYRKVILK